MEHRQQPIVEATDLHDRLKSFPAIGTTPGQGLKESHDFIGPSANLPAKQHVTIVIAKVNG
jgi:hypothetical protein